MNIYKNGENITDTTVKHSHTVSVYPLNRTQFSDFSGITFYKVKSIVLSDSSFTITDEDFGVHTYTFVDRKYKVR